MGAGVAFLMHLVACMWYAWVCFWSSEFQETWLDYITGERDRIGFKYAMSYHWVMAQFTPAPHPAYPKNTPELGFAILMLFLGLAIFSSFLANVSSRFTLMQNKANDKAQEEMRIRKSFVEHSISGPLAASVKAFLSWKGRKE